MVEIRIPPQDIDTEKALLGSIMLNPNAMYEVADIISPDSFYASKHKIIYEAMTSLFSKGDPIDLVTLSGRLKEKKQIKQIGGSAYLSELVENVASPTSAGHYAQIVKAKHILRSLIEAADHIGNLGFDEHRNIEEVMEEAHSKIFSVTSSTAIRKFSAIGESLSEAWERLEMLQKHKDAIRGVPTGFPELDSILSGLQKSDLVILAARPSMGKTSLALDIARQAAIGHNVPVGVFSLEMSTQQLVDRMLAAEAKVNSWKLRTGRIKSDDDYGRLHDAIDKLSEAPIYIDDKSSNTVLSMRSVARRLKTEKDLGLIIVDYLQLITPTSTRASDSMVQQVTEISRALKGMARELDVPVLALSQLSRAIEQRRGKPRLSDLRDSGSIEQDADVVMFIHREDKMSEGSSKTNIAEIMIEKHRNGPTGKIDLYFDEEKTTFLSVEKGNFSDFAQPKAKEEGGEPF